MGKKYSKKHQKIYKMSGCSKSKSRKNNCKYLGGNSFIPTNHGIMHGGTCGTCGIAKMFGAGKKYNMKGGDCGCGAQNVMTGGSHTLEPAGLIGNPWTPNIKGWTGVDGIAHNRNYLDYNSYKSDPQTSLIDLGANRPFLFGGKKRRNATKRKHNKYKKYKQKGGVLSNFIGEDLINLGRQLKFDVGSFYNGINGFSAPVNPMPWKGQLAQTPNLNSVKSMLY
jgi:hypothetical protein